MTASEPPLPDPRAPGTTGLAHTTAAISEKADSAEPVRGVRLPDFFIVGHQKCGTTALYLMLSEHPQIFMPDVKEPWYFARELRSRLPRPSSRSRPNTLEDYLSLFADASADQLAGEASPQYIRSASAARQIAEMQPNARIIAILREPAAFLRSLHLQLVATHIESEKDLRKAIALEGPRREGRQIPSRSISPQSLLYSEHVRYVEQLQRLRDSFPPEQLLILIYEDFRRDNMRTVGEVLRFLEVDDSTPLKAIETKPLKAVRYMWLHQLRRAIRRAGLNPASGGRVTRALDALAPERLSGDALAAMFRRVTYTAQTPPEEGLMLELRRRFKGEVVQLSEYLDRDLVAQWGYDRIS